jgi:hypothetical protein
MDQWMDTSIANNVSNKSKLGLMESEISDDQVITLVVMGVFFGGLFDRNGYNIYYGVGIGLLNVSKRRSKSGPDVNWSMR